MFIIFVDLDDPQLASKCLDAIREVEKIQKKLSQYVGFFYAENKIWNSLKQRLGISWDDLPSLAFNMLDQT